MSTVSKVNRTSALPHQCLEGCWMWHEQNDPHPKNKKACNHEKNILSLSLSHTHTHAHYKTCAHAFIPKHNNDASSATAFLRRFLPQQAVNNNQEKNKLPAVPSAKLTGCFRPYFTVDAIIHDAAQCLRRRQNCHSYRSHMHASIKTAVQ